MNSWLNEAVNVPLRVEFKSSDGWPLQGWLATPEIRDTNGKLPLILQIHGGPHAMYTGTYSHEMQTLVAQGYAVLWINPREVWDTVRSLPELAVVTLPEGITGIDGAVDYALATYDLLDASRLGCSGWQLWRSDDQLDCSAYPPFQLAVTQRCISNWLSMYGTSDIGISYVEGVIGGNPAENAEFLWSRSPLAHAHHIETPLLIMHGRAGLSDTDCASGGII